MSTTPKQRVCVFCGQSGLSREHAYPDWSRQVFPQVQTGDYILGGLNSIEQQWTAPPFTVLVRRVCKTCNNGWMSRLEMSAKPDLEQMMLGRSFTLSPNAQESIAMWAVKTAMMLQYVHSNRMAPIHTAHYVELFQTKKPPDTCMIWASACSNQTPLTVYWVRPLVLDTQPPPPAASDSMPGYRVTFRIGQLALQVFGYDVQALRNPYLIRQVEYGWFAPFIHTLWPPVGGDFSWPPPGVFSADGLEAFALRIT